MKIAEFSVKNYQFTIIIFVMVMLLGFNSLMNMPRDENPPFAAPIFVITAVYPGTNPADMEQLVGKPIEDALYDLDDIKKIITTCNDGLVVMRVEFNYGVDINSKNNDVIREVNKIRPNLPQGLLYLNTNKATSADIAIIQAAIVSETATFEALHEQAEKLQKALQKVPTLHKIEIEGCPERRVEVRLDLEKMAQNGIGLNRVLGSIQAGNVNIPGGKVDIGTKQFNIQTASDFNDIESIRGTVVNSNNEGKVTFLRDIADVRWAYEEHNYITRYNGKRAVWVIASLKERQNIIQSAAKFYPVMEEFKKNLPPDMTFDNAFDQAEGVKDRLGGFARDFSIAIFLVLFTLVPLGWRASLVVMISIPLSLAIGLAFLNIFGFTINQLSIVGLVIALGLLVDDSIVVVENIERFLRMGYSRKDAAVAATKQIGVAIIGCTATLVLAFLPLSFLPEGSGDFIRSLPMAVLLTVLASLFVAITIIPFLSSILLKPHENEEGNFFMRAFKNYINIPYRGVLNFAFKHPIMTLLFTLVLFLSTLLLVPSIGFSLFPKSEKPMLMVNIETPVGTNITATDAVAKDIEGRILKRSDVVSVATNVGKGNPRVYYNTFQKEISPNTAQLFVRMDKEMHMPDIDRFADELRADFNSYAGAKIEVKQFEQGPPVEAPIDLRLFGENLDTLRELSFKIETLLKETEGTIYVNNPLRNQKTDLLVSINQAKAGLLGVLPSDIARTVRLGIAGLDVTKYRDSKGEDFNVNVSLMKDKDKAIETFSKIYITSAVNALIPLAQVANVELQTSPTMIRHFNKNRFGSVSCFVKTGYNTTKLTNEIIKKLDKFPFPKGYSYQAAGEKEASEESFGGMGTIIIIALFGLMAILVLEFRTFKSTLIVLSVIPLGIMGALIALFLVGKTLSFVSVVGMIALVGIEIKNSILLVDYTNQLREDGMDLQKAIMDGAETRFLPILLTTLTAIGGFIPLVLEDAPLYSPLAWVLIGGLISSVLLSRIVTPLLYKLLPPAVTVKSNKYAEAHPHSEEHDTTVEDLTDN